jgi:hypothetical protein
MKKLVNLALLLVIVTSCHIKIVNNINTPGISFKVLKEESYGGRENESHEVVTGKQGLDALYKELRLGTPPDVDFTKNNVVAIFMGQKNTGGYSISVKSITVDDNNTVTVKVRETRPDGGMVTTALTSPYCIAVIPKSKEVIVEFEE